MDIQCRAERLRASCRDVDLAWAAGFFDGEGTTICHIPGPEKNYKSRALQFSISQVKFEPIERFKNSICGPGRIIWQKRIHCYKLYNDAAHISVLLLYPWLSTPKKEQALNALMQFAYRPIGNRAHQNMCQRGHEYTPDNIYIGSRGSKECKECIINRKEWRKHNTGHYPKARSPLAIERLVGLRVYSPPELSPVLEPAQYNPSVET